MQLRLLEKSSIGKVEHHSQNSLHSSIQLNEFVPVQHMSSSTHSQSHKLLHKQNSISSACTLSGNSCSDNGNEQNLYFGGHGQLPMGIAHTCGACCCQYLHSTSTHGHSSTNNQCIHCTHIKNFPSSNNFRHKDLTKYNYESTINSSSSIESTSSNMKIDSPKPTNVKTENDQVDLGKTDSSYCIGSRPAIFGRNNQSASDLAFYRNNSLLGKFLIFQV